MTGSYHEPSIENAGEAIITKMVERIQRELTVDTKDRIEGGRRRPGG